MPSRKKATVLLICALALAASGCRKRTVHAAPPAVTPTPPAPTNPMPPETKPETPPESAPARTPVAPAPKPAPVKPRPDPAKPAPPQISPGLSPEEQAAAERRTYDDMNAAETNLQKAYGKQLNASQHDLVEKIRGFLGQAREAIRASDWVRARNLAQKAHVLSVEMVSSL